MHTKAPLSYLKQCPQPLLRQKESFRMLSYDRNVAIVRVNLKLLFGWRFYWYAIEIFRRTRQLQKPVSGSSTDLQTTILITLLFGL